MGRRTSEADDDEAPIAVVNCDPNGVSMMYISNMIHTGLFGIIFSGKISTDQKCRIMGPNYILSIKEWKINLAYFIWWWVALLMKFLVSSIVLNSADLLKLGEDLKHLDKFDYGIMYH